jgi:hypothetical protein
MRRGTRWLYLIAELAAAFVAISTIVQAARHGSWDPIVSVGWIPAVIVATLPRGRGRCLPRRRSPAD